MIPIARPLLGPEEQEAVLRVLASGQLAQGEVDQFFFCCHALTLHAFAGFGKSLGHLSSSYQRITTLVCKLVEF
jgi:hypothetical protein